MMGQGLAIIPLDLPGITKGKPLDKIGQRPLNQGEIFFEDVKIPKEYMVISPDMGMMEGMGEYNGRSQRRHGGYLCRPGQSRL